MRSDKKYEDRVARHEEILSNLWENLPTAKRRSLFCMFPPVLFQSDLDVRVTPSYAAWLAKRRDDVVTDMLGKEGKMAVQSVLRHSLDTVETLLCLGVDLDVALSILPHELYLVVSEIYRERFETPPQSGEEAASEDMIEFGP